MKGFEIQKKRGGGEKKLGLVGYRGNGEEENGGLWDTESE